MIYKRCHTVTTKLTNLCYLKTYELKALDCQLKATSAFCFEIANFVDWSICCVESPIYSELCSI
ncbi:hypothetical protein ACH0R4_RS16460 [Bacillus cytotoxicus]|uniref:hypothetical protein n=1 Tax=Bacillus cereus group sp. BfR-BA-01492 TaxID=2920361 RepID=UPI001F57B7FB|nr:hypothetical protein [Bacillus cereus group sp. BfR-BA-01492]